MNDAMTTVPQAKGFLVRHFRDQAGLSQQRLADKANLNLKMIQRAENGQMTEYTLLCIARALAIAPVNFYDSEDLQVFLSGRIETGEPPHSNGDPAIEEDSDELLDRFTTLPARYANKVVEIVFERDRFFRRTDANVTETLGLATGSCISSHLKVGDNWFSIFATGDLAETVLDIPVGSRIAAIATTVWGVRTNRDRWDPETIEHDEIVGLVLSQVVDVHG